MVGMAGFEPTTTTPQCGALPDCATSRLYIIFHNFRFNLLLYNMTSGVKKKNEFSRMQSWSI